MNPRRVILASASPRRRELLAALLTGFEVLPSNVPEPLSHDPRSDAVALAEAKANAVAADYPDALVIGSDTVVYLGDRSYEKPTDAGDVLRIWRELRGRPHQVVTGLAVVQGDVRASGWSEASVTLSNLPDDAVRAYAESGRPMDKAGAYAIQDEDVPTVTAHSGCYCCIVGLPLWRLKAMLESRGVTCADPSLTIPRCATCPERPAP